RWGHVRLFSPWRYNLDAAAVRMLATAGWEAPPPDEHPTGAELRARYLLPLAVTAELAPRVRLGARVLSVARLRRDKLKDAARAGYENRGVLVVGGGRWAMSVLQDLVALRRSAPATGITWAVRRAASAELFGGGDGDGLPERAALGGSVRGLVAAEAVRLV